ncbi:MAG: alpha/beta fold hydrolase [bacterium]
MLDPESWSLPESSLAVRARPAEGSDPAGLVVLVHGLGGSALNWVDLMERLPPEYAALAPDLPGFGASPPPRDGDHSPAGHARHVVALADAWRQRAGRDVPVHLFGNSLGGAVALHAAQDAAASSLTLISPALPTLAVGRGNVHLPVVALPGVGEALVRRYSALSPQARVDATLQACFVDPSRVSPELRDALIEEVRMRDRLPYATPSFLASLRGLLASFARVGRGRPWASARRTDCPVLAVYGEDDVLVHPRNARRAARAFPDAEVVVLPDCGHAAQMEHPDAVAALWATAFAPGTSRVS